MSVIRVVFRVIGWLGLFALAALLYLNELVSADSYLHEYRIDILIVFGICFLFHYVYLASVAIKKKQVGWAIVLFLVPLPAYWIYYAWLGFKTVSKNQDI
jgi:hypothetical protein